MPGFIRCYFFVVVVLIFERLRSREENKDLTFRDSLPHTVAPGRGWNLRALNAIGFGTQLADELRIIKSSLTTSHMVR